ncbi:Protein kinase domain containing protein [Coccidioides posadasii C735 delta SOWgp]|uniref:non-specific serine/threonine protein kinase n=1 Tax=Coccidioides posadasii (strain C735) TaxID=222929 RepID=C5PG50_COCP7|nr:Protein kinase domain containing protein [Coccidioides posadasii C735 delta SOWgp]EER23503.1 Protein kinase domain containing protein [Coccidioides posadasii C735 delta SOWgp]|eukprot:XP_003065648.1 Protein kinase domain containing protein [Coccidioides posadasii C735 delta SOWgp]
MAESLPSEAERLYYPESDVEDLEGYRPGGYHPTLIGDTFCGGRYKIVHKLGFGGYSTIWLAHDQQLQCYVSLKILVAGASQGSNEGEILCLLAKGTLNCFGRRFIPTLLDQFSFDGPNGHHLCLVGEPAGCSIANSKENSTNFMFPRDAARSIAAQLIMGLNYLHANDVCHGDLHLDNFLLHVPGFDNLSTAELYKRHGKPYEVPTRRLDGKSSTPHAPPHVIYPMIWNMPANEVMDPEIIISDYGTSFIASKTPSPTLHTPALYSPPEEFFNEHITTAADVWTLGVVLYDAMGERPLFETFSWDPDDIIAEMVNTLGQLPARWWGSWTNRSEFFNLDGSWITNFQRIGTPVFRRLHQRMWDMGRGETPETCEWDVAGGELKALEDMLRAMMAFEPVERPTAKQLMMSEYMVKWAMPAWQRQMKRKLPS